MISRFSSNALRSALCLLFAGQVMAADVAVTAGASLIDPGKPATLHGDRAPNPGALTDGCWRGERRLVGPRKNTAAIHCKTRFEASKNNEERTKEDEVIDGPEHASRDA